ncbi:MAG TPA: alpha/beta hydrolase [Pararhizobium sp.]|uniref:alpha/beta fold hydrolase n=1 Tax=Pararhizobium sp. TaxID=1977563 RepID=UPI002C889884|nr:alpha/beta hydrolase [Pararhizobium sp.]HTO34154.1 alpha/beta hydrolase [Pararhizobium sp.]
MQARFITVNNIRTRYLTAGDPSNTPLLMVHGRILSAEHWFCNIDALGQDFYVVAADTLGSGFTGPADFSKGLHPVEQRVDHLEALVDKLGFGEFYASGSSHGALLSTLLHLRMPDRLTKLVVNGSAAFASPELLADSVDATLQRDDPRIGKLSLRDWHDWMRGYVYDPGCLPDAAFTPVMTAYAQDWVMDCWRESLKGHKEMAKRPDLRIGHRLDQIKADTLLVWGRDDAGAPLSDAEPLVAGIARAKLEVFDNCGHMPMMEHPDRFNAVVRDFLMRRSR